MSTNQGIFPLKPFGKSGLTQIKAGDLKEKSGSCLVIIDYLQLLKGDPGARNRRIELVEMAGGLKHLAKTFDIPILLLYRLDIDMEGRSDKRPNLIDLADVGGFDQQADLVLFIDRDVAYYPYQNYCDRERAEIIIAKNRRGFTGMVALSFVHQCGLFTEFEP